MDNDIRESTAAIIGIVGSAIAYIHLGINWQTFYENAGNLLWGLAVAILGGAGGVLGKRIMVYLIARFDKRKTKTK